MNESFLKRLAEAVEKSGLSKKAFAKNSGISPGYLTDILKGRTIPSERVTKGICSGNSLSESWLIDGVEEGREKEDFLCAGDLGHGDISGTKSICLNEEHRRLIDAWDHAHPELRKAALQMLETSAKESREIVGGGSNCAEVKFASK